MAGSETRATRERVSGEHAPLACATQGRSRRNVVTLLPWITSVFAFAAITAVLVPQRTHLDKAHVVLLYLLIILGSSAWGGRILGITLSCAAFIVFDWAFLPPYNTLVVRDPLDWLVLLAFLLTSLVAAQLLHKARAERAAIEHAESLREVDRLKDVLLASVSHDLRTPLTTIKGVAQELRDLPSSPAVYERALLIEEQADRLNRFVTDLLDTARLNSGALPLDISTNAAEDVLGALENQFTARPDRHRLKLQVDGSDILLGQFDFVHTLRILTNLTENALKYAPVDTPVTVRAYAHSSRLTFEVSDQGPGIPAHIRDRLFEPFTTAHPTSTGLGLSIAHRLAVIQNTTLSYHSAQTGGTTFVVSFPQVVHTSL